MSDDDPYVRDGTTGAMMRRSTAEHRAKERSEVAAAAAVPQAWILGEPPEFRVVTISSVPGLDLVAQADTGIVLNCLGKVDEAIEYVTTPMISGLSPGETLTCHVGEGGLLMLGPPAVDNDDVADVAAFLVERAGVSGDKAAELAEELLDLLST